ncbi:MAG TPA: hypothetical protein VL944_00950 [Candidatus Acidoferrum sp.]|nr:hypothetical protein [Candidatus Acidoferrum sp.]
MATLVIPSEVKAAERLNPDYETVVAMHQSGGSYVAIPNSAGLGGGYITPWKNMHVGAELHEAFTGDGKIVGSVVMLRTLDAGHNLGLFVVHDIESVRTHFRPDRQFLADGLVTEHRYNPNIFSLLGSQFETLGLKEGEKIRYFRDPSAKPVDSLLRSITLQAQMQQQTQPLAGLEDIFPRR